MGGPAAMLCGWRRRRQHHQRIPKQGTCWRCVSCFYRWPSLRLWSLLGRRRREVDSEYACLLYNTLFTARNSSKRNNTRSSAVAVIADRTACDVRYTSKLSNRFRLQLYELLVGYARYDSTGRVYDRTQTLIFSTVDHDHWASVTDQSSVVHEVSE